MDYLYTPTSFFANVQLNRRQGGGGVGNGVFVRYKSKKKRRANVVVGMLSLAVAAGRPQRWFGVFVLICYDSSKNACCYPTS